MIYADEDEIRKALPKLNLWHIQNDKLDAETNFIYFCQYIDQIEDLSLSNRTDSHYALHRWYNYQCSKRIEKMFADNGAVPNTNEKDHDVDFTLFDIPFDVKVSVISTKYTGSHNLANRQNKDAYMQWLSKNASRQGRRHKANKIYVICEDMASKSDFDAIAKRVSSFVTYFKTQLNGTLTSSSPYCELIYVPKNS